MLAGHGDLVVASALDHETLAREGREADILIVRAPLPEALFDEPPRLRAAIRHGAGLDMVPLAAANAAGVLVANTPGVNARTVAEHVFFVSMALLRRFRRIDRDLRTQGWNVAREHTALTHDLSGRSIGIVGMGNIGREVASIAVNGFGLNVAAATRRPGELPPSVAAMPLDALMAASDIVVLCCPLTDETRGMIDAGRIGLMKPDALLVNVARGPVIDDEALIAALREGRIGGAALDVFATQPLPDEHPYFGFENVIVTPHMAGITEESMMRMGTGAAAETLRVLAGDLPINLRNPEVVEHYRRRFPV
jgi:D-3-phosphoglycerate dehydrogenase